MTRCGRPRPAGAVAVEGATVSAVGPAADLERRFPDATVVAAPGKAIVPGLVNAHHHMYGVLAHGIPLAKAPAGFWPFLRDFWWPLVEDALDREMIAAATELACLEMVRSGVTAFYDCLEAPNALPGALEAEAAIVRRWGLRGVLSFEATERAGPEKAELGLQENARVHRLLPAVRRAGLGHDVLAHLVHLLGGLRAAGGGHGPGTGGHGAHAPVGGPARAGL